jgi:hypothetical protein
MTGRSDNQAHRPRTAAPRGGESGRAPAVPGIGPRCRAPRRPEVDAAVVLEKTIRDAGSTSPLRRHRHRSRPEVDVAIVPGKNIFAAASTSTGRPGHLHDGPCNERIAAEVKGSFTLVHFPDEVQS